MKTLTVFTPTYNRAYCLHQLYESLSRQTSKDFEWLIIDDGSTDHTKELVESWIKEGKVKIQYVYKENGGMHTGHNKAYELIETELNVCIDSDDYMPVDAVENIIFLWLKFGSKNYAGIIGLNVTKAGKVIGTSFPEELKVSKYSHLSTKYGVVGDKKIIYRSDVVKKYPPYPSFDGENFVPLYLPIVIDKDFNLLVFNEVFCVVEYLDDGSTLNIYNQYFKHPKGFKHLRKIEMIYYTIKLNKFKSAIHFISTKLILKEFDFISDSPNKRYTFLAIPFGFLWYVTLQFKKNKKRDIKKYI
jgi:glycosyltransferase involved in cell wall biosynthesis